MKHKFALIGLIRENDSVSLNDCAKGRVPQKHHLIGQLDRVRRADRAKGLKINRLVDVMAANVPHWARDLRRGFLMVGFLALAGTGSANAADWKTSVVQAQEKAALTCMTQAIYFEARSENIAGQVAVAEVVLNRVSSRRYPSTVCDVVFQGASRKHRCQFSFACDGKNEVARNRKAWNQAHGLAIAVMRGETEEITELATHYHADYVLPFWAKKLERTAKIGRHIFYRDPRQVASLK